MSKSFRSGFVTIVGRPNVGKSTLLNTLIGQKVAIMSEKPQTTRNTIHGVYTVNEGQIIFVDTPGIHKPKSELGERMNRSAIESLKAVDLVLFLVNVTQPLGKGDRFIIEHLHSIQTPVYLVMNKIDLVHPHDLLPMIDQYRKEYDFKEIIPVSALNGNNVQTITDTIMNDLPEGPAYYPADQVTDHPEHFIIAELIREKLLERTEQEVPHSIAVHIEHMQKRDSSDVIDISAVIFTERPSQKKIVIGHKGKMLKEVGKHARIEIEALLGSRVFLDLWVKVKKDWQNQDFQLRQLGYERQS